MNMKRWTKEEDEYLLKNYKELPFEEVKSYLNRSDNSIRWRAKYILSVAYNKNKAWSESELELINSDLSITEIAKLTGRTYSAVNKRRNIERSRDKIVELFDTSAIEKDVPNISVRSKSAQHFALLLALEVGDSYEFPTNEYPLVRNQVQIVVGRKFETKRWSDDTRRIWRIE